MNAFDAPHRGSAVPKARGSATVGYVNESEQTPRAQYRRRLLQRQSAIFGTLVAIMGVLLILSMLFWTGALPFPWDRDFSETSDPNVVITPCIAKGTKAVDLTTINADVYNSTSRTGIAAEAGKELSDLGVQVGETDNWSGSSLQESARIRTGPDGIASAYTLALYIPDAVIQYDSDMTGASLDVILGVEWDGLSSAKSVKEANPTGTLTSIDGCENVGPTAGED
ncbi:MAG: LytR C-terminal domain-containing protein [Ancrocorticia sp.]|jgi:hypothetical protein|nr:LytR C-terminal domain-containing protein [Ancrocorticia sp.]MCI2178117.1 LytR C-terminal domain-containing protein [Ancrocorticia sp.]MCI2193924.1 LytR C-terminal domain-containing protein [Ancrocorticia sp.]MCI2198597.1 LytR C-terminal domain-containing protein [Ancrocorticia sp.]